MRIFHVAGFILFYNSGLFFYKYGLSIKILIAESPRSFSIPLITCRVRSLTVGNTRNYTQGGNAIS